MPLKTHQEELPSINLTSMIDVLFLLIIFFMVGTRFSENDSSIEINLPKVANGGAMMPAPSGKVVALKADGTVLFDGQVVSIPQLEQALTQATRNYPDLKIEFDGDAKCSLQMASEVWATIKRSGGNNIQMRMANYQMPNSTRR
jgi:biopolymer transport protein ExbD